MVKIPGPEDVGSARTGVAGQLLSAGASASLPLRFANPPLAKFEGVPNIRAGSLLAGGLNDFARLNKRIANKIEEREAYNDRLWANTQAIDAEKHFLDWFDTMAKNPADDVPAEYTKTFNEFEAKVLDAAPSKEAADQLGLDLKQLNLKLFSSALVMQARTMAQKTVIILNDMVDRSGDVIAKDPTFSTVREQQERLFGAVQEGLDTGRIDPKMGERFRESIEDLPLLAAEIALIADPVEAKALVDGAKGGSLARKASILRRIDTAMDTHDAIFSFEQSQLLEAHVTQIEETGEGHAGFDLDLYAGSQGKTGPVKKLMAARAIRQAERSFDGRSQLTGKTPAEMQTILSTFAPKPDSKNFDEDSVVHRQLTTYVEQQEDLFRNEPFMYSLHDDIVRESFRIASEQPDNPGAVHQAIFTSLAKQEAMGIPNGMRSVLTRDKATEIARELNQATPGEVENRIISLMNTYGQYYPDVFRDLSRLPEGTRINTDLQLVALHIGKPWLGEFIEAVRTPDKEFANITDKEKRVLRETMAVNSDVGAMQSAILSSNPNLTPYAEDIRSASTKYATSLLNRGKARNTGEAVDMATQRLIRDEYAFSELHGITFAIKRQYLSRDGTPVKFNETQIRNIEAGLRNIIGAGFPESNISRINSEDIDDSIFFFPDHLTDETRNEAVQDALDNEVFWVTRPDNMGVTLFIPGDGGTSQPLLRKDGSQIEFEFTDVLENHRQLLDRRRQSISESQAQRFFITGP